MLISGLELALSVLAARVIRHRMVSRRRWLGVAVVVVGITLIGLADVLLSSTDSVSGEELKEDDDESRTQRHESIIGLVLIVGQCILSVLQDIAEEMFMQAGDIEDFPPTLLLGMEGGFGFIFAGILFLVLGDTLGNSPSQTLQDIQDDKTFLVPYSVGLTLLFTVTGIFNIKATQVTSAMTRNVWKNLRTVVVWIIALLIFYVGGNESMGEEFVIPESLAVLLGFAIMLSGILLYYSQKAKEEKEKATKEEEEDTTEATATEGDVPAEVLDFEVEV